MGILKRAVFVLSWLVILPASAYAQSALAGIVKDSSGGVPARRDGRGEQFVVD